MSCRIVRDNKVFKLTVNLFIEKAKSIHNNKYEYSLVEYKNNKSKIKIICKKHGIFEQRPDNHLRGKGCKKCSIEKRAETNKLTTRQFIKRAEKIHGNKYNYSKLKHINSRVKVSIICERHGKFHQNPFDHLKGRGCIKCGHVRRADVRRRIPKELENLVKRVRSSISVSFSKKKYSKKSKTYKILGCLWEEFKIHLENNPYNFKISDEDIEFDHIIPISRAETEEEVIALNHYTNFQLLPKFYNRWIKRDKDYDREDFENWLNTITV